MRRKWIGMGMQWAVLVICGCGTSGRPSGEIAPSEQIASCESFAQRFENCQAKLGAPAEATAERAAMTRETLHTQTLAATSESARAALDATCTDGLKQLATVCP